MMALWGMKAAGIWFRGIMDEDTNEELETVLE
jgi:hypothetical protein